MLRFTFPLLFALIVIFIGSCGNETAIVELQNQVNHFPVGTKFHGVGEGFNQKTSDWSLTILENDSILLVERDIRDSANVHYINKQDYGKIILAKDYSFELKISKAIFGSGCDKPRNRYLDTDTIPVYIDSALFINSPKWKLHNGDTTIIITKSPYIFSGNTKYNYDITITPDTLSEYQPMILTSGLRCGINIHLTSHHEKYYLNKKGNSFELIVLDKKKLDKYGNDCNNCLKTIELQRLQ